MTKIGPDYQTEENSLLSISDLASMLQITEASIYSLNYRRTGPPYLRIGKAVRYRRSSVDKWLLDKETATWHP